MFGEHCEIFQTAHMANFEENVEEMVGTTREAAGVASRDGDNRRRRDGGETAGDETAATGGVMYTDEGELEFDEDEMAALEGSV